MIDFQTEDLLSLLKSFYTLTKLKVVVIDNRYREVIAYPREDSAFCTYVKGTEPFRGQCDECVKFFCDSCHAKKDLFIHHCHTGLTEAIFPIIDNNDRVLGYIMFGQTSELENSQALYRHIRETCKDKLDDSVRIREFLGEIHLRTVDEIVSASEILKTVAGYIIMKQFIVEKSNYLLLDINHYIEEHIDEKITVEDICKKLYLSKTTLYRVMRKEKCENLNSLITHKKIALAEKLLTTTDLTVSEIAKQTGFSDVNYFGKRFQKQIGMVPTAYRKKFRHETKTP